MEHKEITIKGKKLSYRTSGEGPVIILIHGFGEDGSIWENQYDIFPNHHVIIPDLPGSGQSEIIDDMSMEGLADAIKEIILHETAELYFKEGEPHSVVMIGHSMGGYITLAFAEKYPHMLRGFGLFHSTAYADSEEKKETRRKGIEFIETNGAAAFLKTSTPNLYAPATREKFPALINNHINKTHNFSGAALVLYMVSMINRPDRTHILKQTHLPVLFILGKYDTAVPIKDGLEQVHLPDLSYIHVLEESGHMGMIEERAVANRILNEYISGIETITKTE